MRHPLPIMGFEDMVGKYSGRCFLIGGGPSLNDTPLHLLKNEYSFGMNNISKIFHKTSWRPQFFMNTSRAVPGYEKFIPYIGAVAKTGATCFLSCEFGQYIRGDMLRFMHVGTILYRAPNKYDWSDNPYWVFQFGTSVYPAIQIAIGLGFSEIFLLGCDMGWIPWEGKDPNHFDPDYNAGIRTEVTPEWADAVTWRMKVAHMKILERAKERGVKVYNATVGGELEVYPRVNLMEVLNV